MDINSLFNQPGQKTTTKPNVNTRQISLVSYLNTKPLIFGLEQNRIKHNFILQKDVPSVCAQRLAEGDVSLGIIPSIEYIQGKGSWKIVPDLCIGSRGQVKSVNLFFNKDMRDINTIALDTSSKTSVMLLKLLLQEKYQIQPEYILMAPNLEEMLKKADAALIIGDRALHYGMENPAHLDLSEEWYDLTGLPFVFAFWAGHENVVKPDDIQNLLASYKLGIKNLDKIAADFAVNEPLSKDKYSDYLTESIRYDFGPEEKQGLEEFYRYCFYLGLTEHIPELHFYEV